MIFLYTSTTILYFVFVTFAAIAVSAGILTDKSYIIFISIVMLVVAIFGIIITGKVASKKYNKTLFKLDYDIHGFLNEQCKFLNKMFINKSVKNIVKNNIACGLIYNEQYDEALKILGEFSAIGYQGFSPMERFLMFMNQADCYIELGKLEMVMPYIRNSEIILRTARFPDNIRYEISMVFDYMVARYNYEATPNSQTAQELINKINIRLSYKENDKKYNFMVLHYELGVLYTRLGDTSCADSEFYHILRSGSSLPYVNRIKAYNKTGDMSILKL